MVDYGSDGPHLFLLPGFHVLGWASLIQTLSLALWLALANGTIANASQAEVWKLL